MNIRNAEINLNCILGPWNIFCATQWLLHHTLYAGMRCRRLHPGGCSYDGGIKSFLQILKYELRVGLFLHFLSILDLVGNFHKEGNVLPKLTSGWYRSILARRRIMRINDIAAPFMQVFDLVALG